MGNDKRQVTGKGFFKRTLAAAAAFHLAAWPLPPVPLHPAADWKEDKPGPAALIENVSIQSTGKFTKVIIQSDRALKYRDIRQERPPGIFLYMSAPTLCKRPAIQKVYGDLLEEVRFGYKGAQSPTSAPLPVDYVFLKLTEPATHKIVQKDWILLVELQPRGGRTAAAEPSETALGGLPAPTPPPRKKTDEILTLPPEPTLQNILDVGLANNGSLRLAEEEHRLSKLRYFETTRALFPSVAGKYQKSVGRLLQDPSDPTDDTDFTRKEIGLQLGQPIFQSGRLYYSLRQSSMQKRMAAQNVEKTRAETTFEIKKAYYNLIKAQRALKARRDLAARAEKILELSRKKRQLDLITEAESLGVESQESQIHYRLLSDEKDLEIARLRMEALLNLPEPLPGSLPDPQETLSPETLQDVDAPVESFVEQAMQNRPEMLSAGYTARFHTYGEKVTKAEGRLRVDASGFVGKSGGAFEQETLRLRSSWNVGVQASMFFAGNSIKGTGTAEKTSPDLGESSRSQTRAQTAMVGFLDGLKTVADRRQARINKERALMELDQMRRNVEVEVREAYYNFEKAKLQLKGAQQELDYREKQAGIARQKERMNLIEPTESLSAESSYTEALISHEDAAAFYHVSLASLEKAVGLPLNNLLEVR